MIFVNLAGSTCEASCAGPTVAMSGLSPTRLPSQFISPCQVMVATRVRMMRWALRLDDGVADGLRDVALAGAGRPDAKAARRKATCAGFAFHGR